MMCYEIDGITIPMRIEYILVSDGTVQKTLFPIQNVVGTIDPVNPSILHFINAFDNIDVTYRAEKGGFHQDVKIKNLDSLKTTGLNEQTAKVYVHTKIDNSSFAVNNISINKGVETVDIANPIFSSTTPDKSEHFILSKLDNGNNVPIFGFDKSAIFDAQGKESTIANRQIAKYPNSSGLYFIESVALSELKDNSIIDYYGWYGPITSDTIWTADTNYIVTADINLSAQLLIEPGTLIQFQGICSINVNSGGKIIAKGEPWNYIVFTSQYGTSPGSYDEAININAASTESKIQYCKIKYAARGIQIQNCSLSTPIRDNIITNCNTGIRFLNNAENDVINNLIVSCGTYGIDIQGLEGTYELYNNTIDSCGIGIYVNGDTEMECPTVNIEDSLITNWTTNGIKVLFCADMQVSYVTYKPDSASWKSGVEVDELGDGIQGTNTDTYLSNVLGNYYLDTSVVSGGSTDASNRQLDAQSYTYKPPYIYDSNDYIITEDTTWNKYADSGYNSSPTVKRGYHHNRVDYLINDTDLDVTNGTLTIEPGVVTAIHATTTFRKIHITVDGDNTGKIYCAGKRNGAIFEYPIIAGKTQVSMLVEKPVIGSASECTTGIRLESADYYNKIRYTKFIGLQNGIVIAQSSQYEIMDCVFAQLRYGITCLNYLIETQNNLMYYSTAGVRVMNTGACSITFRNLTCDYCDYGLFLDSWDDKNIEVTDSLFSNCDYGIKFSTNEGTLDEDYNRYYNVTTNISTGGTMGSYSRDLGDDPEDTPYDTAYEQWKDRWYLETKTGYDGCVNAGSKDADESMVSEYTTVLGADLEDADSDLIDIGYHYEDIVPPTIDYHIVDNPIFSPNADEQKDLVRLATNSFSITEWKLEIKDSAEETVYEKTGETTYFSEEWDGGSETDEDYTYFISGNDLSGNPFETINGTITIDTVAPTNPSISIDEGATTTDRYINLTLSADDAAEMIISENEDFQGADWEEYAEEKEFALSLGGGSKIVYAKFRDAAWNETASVNDTITYDAAPAIGNVVITNRYFSPNDDDIKDDITVTASLSETCDWSLQVIASDSTVVKSSTGTGTSIDVTWDGVYDNDVVEDGCYKLVISAEDEDENPAVDYFNTIFVDTTAPDFEIKTPQDSGSTEFEVIPLHGISLEPLDSVLIEVSLYPTGTPSYQVHASISGKSFWADIKLYDEGDGMNKISIIATDKAGNTSAPNDILNEKTEPANPADSDAFMEIIEPLNYSIFTTENADIEVSVGWSDCTLSVKINDASVPATFTRNDAGNMAATVSLVPLYEDSLNTIEITASIPNYQPLTGCVRVFQHDPLVCYTYIEESIGSDPTADEVQYYNPKWFQNRFSAPFSETWESSNNTRRTRLWANINPPVPGTWGYTDSVSENMIRFDTGTDIMWDEADGSFVYTFHTAPNPYINDDEHKSLLVFYDFSIGYDEKIGDYALNGIPLQWLPDNSTDAYVEIYLEPDTNYTILSDPMIPAVDKSFAMNRLFMTVASTSGNNFVSGKKTNSLIDVYVLLTFDDGPWYTLTGNILKFLENPGSRLRRNLVYSQIPTPIPGLKEKIPGFQFNEADPSIKAAFFLFSNRPHTPKNPITNQPYKEIPEGYGGYLWSDKEKAIVAKQIQDKHIVGIHRQQSYDGYDFTPWDNLNPNQQNAKALNNLTEKDPAKLIDPDGDDITRVKKAFEENGKQTNWLISDIKRGKEMVKEIDEDYVIKYYRPPGLTCGDSTTPGTPDCHKLAYSQSDVTVTCIRGTGGDKEAIVFGEESIKIGLYQLFINSMDITGNDILRMKSKPKSIILIIHDTYFSHYHVEAIIKGVSLELFYRGYMPRFVTSDKLLDELLEANIHWRPSDKKK